MLIFGERHLRRVLATYATPTTHSGRIERCSYVHHARKRLSPSRCTAGSGVDRSPRRLINQYEPTAETADQTPWLKPDTRTRHRRAIPDANQQ
jgi:hypothetical protein